MCLSWLRVSQCRVDDVRQVKAAILLGDGALNIIDASLRKRIAVVVRNVLKNNMWTLIDIKGLAKRIAYEHG